MYTLSEAGAVHPWDEPGSRLCIAEISNERGAVSAADRSRRSYLSGFEFH